MLPAMARPGPALCLSCAMAMPHPACRAGELSRESGPPVWVIKRPGPGDRASSS